MENKMLAWKLREISRGTGSVYKKQLFRKAARRIEEQGALLEKARDLMLRLEKILPERDYDCALCDHGKDERPCFKSNDFPECAECPHDCFCKECTTSNTKWVNSVMREIIVKVGGGESCNDNPSVCPLGRHLPLQGRLGESRNDRGESENAEEP